MLFKVVSLLFLTLVVLAPALFNERLKVEGSTLDDLRKIRQRSNYLPRYKGPRTDERINRMLAESIALLKELGVPISNSISPEVVLNSSRATFGRCCPKGSRKKYTEYDYYIEISGFTLNNSERSLRNTLIHEVIHTVPEGLCHTGEWKKWAKFVSAKTGYHIQRIGGGDDTKRDETNLRRGGIEEGFGKTPIIRT